MLLDKYDLFTLSQLFTIVDNGSPVRDSSINKKKFKDL